MTYTDELAPELIPVLEAYRSQPAPPAGMETKDVFRAMLEEMARQVAVESTDEVRVENRSFTNADGVAIQLRVFAPLKLDGPLPCLYWMHGGGTMSGLPEQEDATLYGIALSVGCVVVSVGYRLAPEHPYPAPVHDCYEGLVHVAENAEAFGIDRERIAVGGGSAGGLLSTSCALIARERGGPALVHQSLTYPMLDHRGVTESSREITDLGVWDRDANLYGFGCYLQGTEGDVPPLAVPALVDDLAGLPPAFLAVGTMDVLRDETIEYAQRLAAAGVRTELHLYPGMTHIFDALVPESASARDLVASRNAALRRAFGA